MYYMLNLLSSVQIIAKLASWRTGKGPQKRDIIKNLINDKVIIVLIEFDLPIM